MKNLCLAIVCLTLLTGCSGAVGSGMLGGIFGAGAAGGGYEYNLNRQKDRVEQDFNASLSSNSKCNTSRPDGLWCCHTYEIIPTSECRQTCDHEPGIGPRPFGEDPRGGVGSGPQPRESRASP